jgi:cyclopropane fatty-acyl-phospholipid synthase-like methyltransferase
MCIHYGYWNEDTPNLRTALTNMNVRVAEFARIKPGELVLDAGCGVFYFPGQKLLLPDNRNRFK